MFVARSVISGIDFFVLPVLHASFKAKVKPEKGQQYNSETTLQ